MIFAKTVSAREEIMCMSSGGFSQIVETCLQKWGRRRNETAPRVVLEPCPRM
jgi:hypothetical protein